jgi:AraC-like DNA-binding protein
VLKIFKPQSKILQKYLEFFYVFEENMPNEFSYIAFPHTNTGISFFSGVKIRRENYQVCIDADNSGANSHSVEIVGKYTQPVFVHYKGCFEEISLIFKPLGANHFLSKPFGELAANYSQAIMLENWQEFAPLLFAEKNTNDRIEKLEKFLLENLKEIDNSLIYKALTYLENFEENYSVEEVAVFLDMNLKTFQRFFVKNMACSPSEYKRIARFRYSVDSKVLSSEIKKLTHISYESNYYDQSYFIREFKKLTELNPKKFFEEITIMEEKKIIWKIK